MYIQKKKKSIKNKELGHGDTETKIGWMIESGLVYWWAISTLTFVACIFILNLLRKESYCKKGKKNVQAKEIK